MIKITKYIVLILSIFAFIGCKEIYRYPCQNPANKNSTQCKPEICEVTRTCPKIL